MERGKGLKGREGKEHNGRMGQGMKGKEEKGRERIISWDRERD